MVARIKFTKTGSAKFIGHLDLLRYFQKAFKRAKLDLTYSQGYNPHSLLTFASPLGVGLTSQGEYLDVTLNSSDEPEIMMDKINKVMANNISVTQFDILPDDSKNAMAVVGGADYLVSLKDGYEFLSIEDFKERFKDFYNQDTIKIIKKTKKSSREIDLKDHIYKYAFTLNDFNSFPNSETNMCVTKSQEQLYNNGLKIYIQLASGSVENIKPELVMETFHEYLDIPYNEFAFQVHRLELYADVGKKKKENSGGSRKLVPLGKMYN